MLKSADIYVIEEKCPQPSYAKQTAIYLDFK